MARTPSGTITSVCMGFLAPVTITGISNAAEAVASAAGHALTAGAVGILETSWGKINYIAVRVKSAVAGTSFVLEDIDTTSEDLFPPGAGAGRFIPVDPTKWVALDRTKGHTSSGGDAKTSPVKWVENDFEVPLFDGFSAVTRSFEMDADMLGTPAYKALRKLTQTQANTIVRRRAKTGAMTLLPATVSFNEEEIESEGQAVVCKGTMNAQNRSMRYGPAPV